MIFPFSQAAETTHMLRCRSIASLRRTVSTPPLVDFSRVSPLDLLSSLQEAFFSVLLVITSV
jgi:hypothetical protein